MTFVLTSAMTMDSLQTLSDGIRLFDRERILKERIPLPSHLGP